MSDNLNSIDELIANVEADYRAVAQQTEGSDDYADIAYQDAIKDINLQMQEPLTWIVNEAKKNAVEQGLELEDLNPQKALQRKTDFETANPGWDWRDFNSRDQNGKTLYEKMHALTQVADYFTDGDHDVKMDVLSIPEEDRPMFMSLVYEQGKRKNKEGKYDRGFWEKTYKKFTRGMHQVSDNFEDAWINVLNQGTEDEKTNSRFWRFAQGIRKSQDTLTADPNSITPIRWLKEGFYGAVEMAPSIGYSVVGGTVGGVATKGNKLMQFLVGSGFWSTQMAPENYFELTDLGVDEGRARVLAGVTGILQGMVEHLQMTQARKAFHTAGIKDFMLNSISVFGLEMAEEEMQELLRMGMIKLEESIGYDGIKVDWQEQWKRHHQTFWEAAKTLPWIMAPGRARTAWRSVRTHKQMSELLRTDDGIAQWMTLNPEDAFTLSLKKRISREDMKDLRLPAMSTDERTRLHAMIKLMNLTPDKITKMRKNLEEADVDESLDQVENDSVRQDGFNEISDETIKQVNDSLLELGYEPNQINQMSEADKAEIIEGGVPPDVAFTETADGTQMIRQEGVVNPWEMTREEFEDAGEGIIGGQEELTNYGRNEPIATKFYFTGSEESTMTDVGGYKQVGLGNILQSENYNLSDYENPQTEAEINSIVNKALKNSILAYVNIEGKLVRAKSYEEIPEEMKWDGDVRLYSKAAWTKAKKSGVYDKTLDLSDPAKLPDDLIALLKTEGIFDPDAKNNYKSEYSEALIKYARKNGYGQLKVLVGESSNTEVINLQDYLDRGRDAHRAFVEQAYTDGKPIPGQVIAEYQDLQTRPSEMSEEEVAEKAPVERTQQRRAKITRDDLIRAFPGAQLALLPHGLGWAVEFPSGFSIKVLFIDEIKIDWALAERQEGRPISDEERANAAAYGEFILETGDGTHMDGLSIVNLVRDLSTRNDAKHEAIHVARQMGFFTEKEWNALVDKYSDQNLPQAQQEEDIANARNLWGPTRSFMKKVKIFFNGILSKLGLVKLDAQMVVDLLESGAIFGRMPAKFGVGARFKSSFYSIEYKRRIPSLPVKEPEVRGLFEEVDIRREMEGKPEVVTDLEIREEAERRLEINWAKERANIIQKGTAGINLTPEETAIAIKITATEGMNAVLSGDVNAIKEAMDIIDAYRETGTAWARSGRQRQDPLGRASETRQERIKRVMVESIITPSRKIRTEINKAKKNRKKGEERGNQAMIDKANAQIDRLKLKHANQVADIKLKLKNMGINLERLGDLAPEKLGQVIGVISAAKADPWDCFYEYWRNSILSGIKTQVVNIVGNTAYASYVFGIRRPVSAMVNAFIKNPSDAQIGEIYHMIAGMKAGFARATEAMVKSWQGEIPYFEESIGRWGVRLIEDPNIAIAGGKGRLIRAPQRALLAMDQWAKAMTAQIEVGAQAFRIAKAEGLEGKALEERMDILVLDLESPAWDLAMDTANELTFQTELGKYGQLILMARKNAPGLRYIVPFVTTPVNIFKTGLRQAPIIADIRTAMKVWKGFQTGDYDGLSQNIAEQMMAWIAFWMVASVYDPEDRWITGSLEELGRGGKRLFGQREGTPPPQSIKTPVGWVSYKRIEPFATMLALVVDMVNTREEGEIEDVIPNALGSLTGQVLEKTWLRGISDIIKAVQGFQEGQGMKPVAKWISNFSVSWVPNVWRQISAARYEKYPDRRIYGDGAEWYTNLIRHTINRTELGFFDAPPKVDLWGREIDYQKPEGSPTTDWIFRILSPFAIQGTDIFVGDRMILNYNNQISDPDEKEYYPIQPRDYYEVDKVKYKMTRPQYEQYAKVAGDISRHLIEIEAPADVDNPTKEDIETVAWAIREGRAIAKKLLHKEWYQGGLPAEINTTDLAKQLHDKNLIRKARLLGRSKPKYNRRIPDSRETLPRRTEQWLEGRRRAKEWLDARGLTVLEALKAAGRSMSPNSRRRARRQVQ